MRTSRIFKSNGAAPSLSQVVRLAQEHVNERSKRTARAIDRKIYEENHPPRKSSKPYRRLTKYEKIDAKFDSYE